MTNIAPFAEPWAELSWRPSDSTEVVSLPVERLQLQTVDTWDEPIPEPVTVLTTKMVPAAAKPRLLTVALRAPTVNVVSYSFRPSAILQSALAELKPGVPDSSNAVSLRLHEEPERPLHVTRLKPPADTVKLTCTSPRSFSRFAAAG